MERPRFPGEQFSTEMVDSARALMVVHGLSSRKAAQVLTEMFPAQDIPNWRTLALWRSEMQEITQEELKLIEQNERERILQVDEIVSDTLALVQRSGTMGLLWAMKNLIPLNAIRGTDMDKQLKRQQLAQDRNRPDQRSLIFVLSPNQALSITEHDIEGELADKAVDEEPRDASVYPALSPPKKGENAAT